MDNSQLIQAVVMGALLVGITGVGCVALYRAGRPGWWLPLVFMVFLFAWPFMKTALLG
ncbi:MAG: hypothetical protein GX049_02325 [Alcaligenaceae bacterium]|nr:hypothetical protein [Alcaligenaceae bacterium]